MQPQDDHQRLSRITTVWTEVAKAHGSSTDVALAARAVLIDRYHKAAYRYLLRIVGSAEVADELFQEFALKFARGALHTAQPKRGRFRNFLKTGLANLVHDYNKHQRRRREKSGEPLEELVAAPNGPESEASFVAEWRAEIIAKAWEALAAYEQRTGRPYDTLLRYRAANRDCHSKDMARYLNESVAHTKPFTETAVRKLLQRAREQFAELLLNEVAMTMEDISTDELEKELAELKLLENCRSALQKRKGRIDAD